MPNPGVAVGIDGTAEAASGVDRVTRNVRDLIKSLESLKNVHASVEIGGERVQARLQAAAGATQARVAANPRLAAPASPSKAAEDMDAFAAKFARDMAAADKNIAAQQQRLAASNVRQVRAAGRLGTGTPEEPQQLGAKDASLLARTLGTATEKKEETQVLGKLAKALGWLPGLPGGQNVYLAQMAGAALGLGGTAIAGITGGLLAGGTALALNQAYTDQLRNGEQLQGNVGSTPGGSGNGAALALSSVLAAQEWLNNLKSDQAAQVASGLAQGGVNTAQGTGPALDAAEKLMSLYGVQGPVAVQLVTQAMEQLGYNADAAKQQMMALAEVARATGTPAASLAGILATAPNLQALPGGQGGELANAYKAAFGTDQMAGQMAALVSRQDVETQARLGSYLNLDPAKVAQMQQSQAGQAKLADLVGQQYAQQAATNAALANTRLNATLGIDLAGNQPLADQYRRAFAGGASPVEADLARTQADEERYRQDTLAKMTKPGESRNLSPQDRFPFNGGGAPPKSVPEYIKSGLAGLVQALTDWGATPSQAQLQQIYQQPVVGAAWRLHGFLTGANDAINGTIASTDAALASPAGFRQAAGNAANALAQKAEAVIHIVIDQNGRQSFYDITTPLGAGGNQATQQYTGGYHAPGKGPLG